MVRQECSQKRGEREKIGRQWDSGLKPGSTGHPLTQGLAWALKQGLVSKEGASCKMFVSSSSFFFFQIS